MLPHAFLTLLLGILELGSLAAPAQPAPSGSLASVLKAQKWQKRVLLLCAPTPGSADLRRQLALLEPARAGLETRDVVVRPVVTSQLSAADQRYLRQQLRVAPTTFTVLLIGKDGGVKQRETQPVSPAQLFSTIDAMPMRQQEMRRPK